MPQSFSAIHIHLIFSTKNRLPLITSNIAPALHAYLSTVCRAMNCPTTIVNGTSDHVHILCSLSRTVPVCDLVEEVKKRSSKWIKTQGEALSQFQWQVGYGAFSIGQSGIKDLRQYITNQAKHHRHRSFQDECRALLAKYGVEPDEQHMWE